MELIPIITSDEVSELARPIYSEVEKINRYIEEAELIKIKPAIGDDLYVKIKSEDNDMTFRMLLEGGVYQHDGKDYQFAGLKRALAYYVYSMLIESSSLELTRQGAVIRRSEYSDEADREERVAASRETYAIADRYMEECLYYLENKGFIDKCLNAGVYNNRITIKKIGK